MVLTKEERVELMKKARQAKIDKKKAKEEVIEPKEEVAQIPKVKKEKPIKKTLELDY
jgi:hypothetical protein